MSDRPGNFPGHRAKPDSTNTSSNSRAYGNGRDSNSGRGMPPQGRPRDGQNGCQEPYTHSAESLENKRESFLVPHTRCVFAEHPNMSPYDWPSMQKDADTYPPQTSQRPRPTQSASHDPGTRSLEKNQRPVPTHSTSHGRHGPGLDRTESWDKISNVEKDRGAKLRRNLSAKDKLLAARGHNVSQERLSPGGNPGSLPMASSQGCLREREKKGPPIAYNRHAANFEGAAARNIAPFFSSSGNLRESRNAAGVDTFIQSLKDRPLPDKGSLRDDYEYVQPMAPPGRKTSFESPNNGDLRRHGSRKASFQEERSRNNNRGNLDNYYSQFSPQTDSYGNQHRRGESAFTRSPEDYRHQQSQISPPMHQLNRNASCESSNPANMLRPDSHQMFDPQYYRDNGLSHHQQGRQHQGRVLTQPQSNLASATNNGTMQRNKSFHFCRTDRTAAQLPSANPRESLSYGELQSWPGRTISLYRDVKFICCQCNGHSNICNPGHMEGWDLTPFICWGGQRYACNHIPCSNCDFHAKKLRKMAVWPTRRTLNENTLAFGSVRWTWLCYSCGAVKRTDQPAGSHPLSWNKKWECDGCGKDWNEACPTFLIEDRDVDELSNVAENLLRAPPVSRFSPETKKEKRDLGQRVEGVVHKAGTQFKRLVGKTEVREIFRPSTSKSYSKHHRFGSFGEIFGQRDRSSRKDLRKERTENPLRRVETVDRGFEGTRDVPERSPRRPEPDVNGGHRQKRREPVRQKSSPQLGTMRDVDRDSDRERDRWRKVGKVKMNVPPTTAHKRKNSMF